MSVFNLPQISSPMEKFLGAVTPNISSGISGMFETHQQMQQGRALGKMLGMPEEEVENFARSDPEMQKLFVKGTIDQQKNQAFSAEGFSNVLDQMEEILDRGDAGTWANFNSYMPWGSKAREGTAEFQSLGTSLLGLVQKVALKRGITNQKEFQSFMDRTIPAEGDTQETARGKIKALRSYLQEFGGGAKKESPSQKGAVQDGKVSVIAPDGKTYRIPKDRVQDAIRGGGKLA